MAIHTCKACGRNWTQQGPGKPSHRCPSCRAAGIPIPKDARREIKQEETPRPIPQQAITELPKDIDAPKRGGIYKASDVITEDKGYENRFAGLCLFCGENVPTEQGYRLKVNDRWTVRHTHCNIPEATQQEATQAITQQEAHDSLIRQVGESDAATAIQTLLKTLAPSIDEDGVKRIVNEAIGNRLSDEAITAAIRKAGVIRYEITINDREVEMPKVHHYLLPALVKRLAAGIPGKRLNVFLPGPAGSGKSTAAEMAANMLGLEFGSLSLGPTTPTSKFFGYMDANGNFIGTEFYRIYKDGGVFLIDEMDNGHPGLLAELNQALANSSAAFACGMIPKNPEFRCIATGNTFGRGGSRLFVGRNVLDAATLDRFTIMEWPVDENMETNAAMAWSSDDTASLISDYVTLVQKVRKAAEDASMQIVVSPRASIDGAMMLAAGIPLKEVINERLVPGMAADVRRNLGIEVR